MALDGLADDAVDALTITTRRHRGDDPVSEEAQAKVRSALTDASIERTMDGASTLTLEARDPNRELVNADMFQDDRAVVTVGAVTFRLTTLAKRGSQVTFTFEDEVVNELRRHEGEKSVKAGEVTRSGFVRQLLAEAGVTQAMVEASGPAQVQFERGEDEDSWEVITRLARDRNWRAFSMGTGAVFASDRFLVDRAEAFRLREHASGVDDIDFTVDTSTVRPDSATVHARATRWQVPPGHPVVVEGFEPLKGGTEPFRDEWLVAKIARGLFSSKATITLARPQKAEPEPDKDEEVGV